MILTVGSHYAPSSLAAVAKKPVPHSLLLPLLLPLAGTGDEAIRQQSSVWGGEGVYFLVCH